MEAIFLHILLTCFAVFAGTAGVIVFLFKSWG